MADSKISALTALTGANAASTDSIAIVDADAAQTKQMTLAQLTAYMDLVKSPIIYKSTGTNNHTGDTSETVLDTVTIPAGTMGANGFIQVRAFWDTTTNNTTAPTVTVNARQSATDTAFISLAGAGMWSVGAAKNCWHTGFIWADNSTSALTYPDSNASENVLDYKADRGNEHDSATISIDTTSEWFIDFNVTLGVSGNNCRLVKYVIELFP